MKMEYDPETCITAGELRKVGLINLPDNVPDCAWIPRWAYELGVDECTESDEEQGQVGIRMTVRFTQPFRWEVFVVEAVRETGQGVSE